MAFVFCIWIHILVIDVLTEFDDRLLCLWVRNSSPELWVYKYLCIQWGKYENFLPSWKSSTRILKTATHQIPANIVNHLSCAMRRVTSDTHLLATRFESSYYLRQILRILRLAIHRTTIVVLTRGTVQYCQQVWPTLYEGLQARGD
jgi:hypothetical protein